MSSGKQTDVLITDFSKAFDKVSHSLLVHKLYHYGIRGKTNIWIQNFLSNRSQAVVVQIHQCRIRSTARLCPWSLAIPVLHKWYATWHDLNSGTFCRWYHSSSAVTLKTYALNLQSDLNKLGIWEKNWKMELHPDKCNILTISKKANPIKFNYKLHGHTF